MTECRFGAAALKRESMRSRGTFPGFFVGRYDVRFSSVEGLRAGEGLKILELNGAASEATSAYDAKKSLGEAYRILFRQ